MKTSKITILGYVLGGLMIFMGFPKVIGAEMSVEGFERWGLEDPMRLIVGITEIILGALMFIKPTRNIAAFALFCMMPAGAVAHIAAEEWAMLLMPVIIGILFLIYLISKGVINLRGNS